MVEVASSDSPSAVAEARYQTCCYCYWGIAGTGIVVVHFEGTHIEGEERSLVEGNTWVEVDAVKVNKLRVVRCTIFRHCCEVLLIPLSIKRLLKLTSKNKISFLDLQGRLLQPLFHSFFQFSVT